MTDPRLAHVLDRIRDGGPMDDDPRDYEPDGHSQAELDRLADERADLEWDRRNR